ncbi:MAG: hypothetical protein GWQ05_26700 [Verrucomicrobiaceae bacterium]|nr:hypothetical protein [Verrucomicrobiaceae bacterium]
MSEELSSAITSLGNRLLALYGATPITPGDKPIFHAQAPIGTEDAFFSTEQFEEATSSLTTFFGNPSDDSDSYIPNGGAQYLGIFDQGEHHLNFATLSRREVSTPGEEGLLTYFAASMNNVNGKIISLYCNAPAEPGANRTLAREELVTWQRAVLASNPATQSETMSTMRRGAIISGIAGQLGALIGMLLLKRNKT